MTDAPCHARPPLQSQGRFTMQGKNAQAAASLGRPVTIESGLAEAQPSGRAPEPVSRSVPLLEAWPKGYERGGFRLTENGVVIFANGQPDLVIPDPSSLGSEPVILHGNMLKLLSRQMCGLAPIGNAMRDHFGSPVNEEI